MIITIISTVISIIVTTIISIIISRKQKAEITISGRKIKNITNESWELEYSQIINNKKTSTSGKIKFKVSITKNISGTFYPKQNENSDKTLRLYNCEFDGIFFWGQYSSLDNSIKFGTFLTKLNANSNKFEGKFVGYGNDNEIIITGNLEAKKTPI